ncbi:hypothetical protein MRB53_040783 [Persea americana]|nr:hypothetical protein MRB53_040783 [Persea americana]
MKISFENGTSCTKQEKCLDRNGTKHGDDGDMSHRSADVFPLAQRMSADEEKQMPGLTRGRGKSKTPPRRP